MSHLETMIKNILAIVGGLTLTLFLLVLSYAGGQVYSEYKESVRIKELGFINIQKNIQDSFSQVLVNGALCDYTDESINGKSQNCEITEKKSQDLKNSLVDLSELMESECPSHIKDYQNPVLLNLYKFLGMTKDERVENNLFYGSEVVQEALINTVSDISVFDFVNSCKGKGNGTVIEKVETNEVQD